MLRDLDTTMHHIVKTTMQHNVKRLEQGICMGRAWGKHDRYICAASGRPELPAVQLEECSLNCAHSTVTTCNSPVYVMYLTGRDTSHRCTSLGGPSYTYSGQILTIMALCAYTHPS